MTVMCPICLEWFDVDDEIFFTAIEEDLNDEQICDGCCAAALEFWQIKKNCRINRHRGKIYTRKPNI